MRTWRRPRLVGHLLGLATAWLLAVSAAVAGTPQGQWQTLHSANFRFHFLPQDAEAAHTLAAMAPTVHRYVTHVLTAQGTDAAQLDPGVVDILLVSWTDMANGLSTQIPYNQIQIHLFPPRSFETLQSYRSWLETVFVHEYTHAVHIAMARGPTRWLRYVLGRSIVNGVYVSQSHSASSLSLVPVLPFFTGFPNQFLPSWDIEGLAVNVESWATGRGRLYAAQTREIMHNAALGGTLPRWDDLSNFGRSDWPYGTADYLYGAGFLGSLTREQAVGFQRTNALGLLPMLPWAAFRAGNGLSLSASWQRYRYSLRTAAIRQRLARDREPPAMTLAAYGDRSSLTSDGQSFFWIERDGSRVTSLVQAAPSGDSQATEWKLTRQTARGAEWIGINQDWIAAQVIDWPSRAELRNRVVLWRRSDRKLFEPDNGWRMLEPSLNAQNDIATIRHSPQASELWLGQVISDGSLRWPAAPAARSTTESFHTPSVSPSGARVAYVAHRGISAHDILLWERSTGQSRVLYSSEREDLLPIWLDEDRLQFVSDRSDDFQIYSLSLTDTSVSVQQHSHTAHGWYQIASMGSHTAALRLTAEGYSVTVVDTADLPTQIAMAAPSPYSAGEMAFAEAEPGPVTAATITDYSPWRMLLPHAWTPIMYLRSTLLGGHTPLVNGLGASLGSTDLLSRHSWSLSAASRLDKWQPEGAASYAYAGARVDGVATASSYVPTLQVPTRTSYEARYQSAALYGSWLHPRRTQSFSLSAGAQVLDFARPEATLALGDGKFFGLAGGPFLSLGWNNYTRTPRVNGPHDGFHAALRPQLWITRDATGQQSTLAMGLAELGAARHFFARNRLAARIWAGASTGDVLRYRAFAISGDNWTTTSGDGSGFNPLSGVSLLGLQVNQADHRTWAYQYVGSEIGAFQLLLDQPLWMPERGWANLVWFQGLRLIGYFEGAVLDFTTLGHSSDWTMPPTVGAEIESSWAFVDMIGLRLALGYHTRPVYGAHELSVRLRMGL